MKNTITKRVSDLSTAARKLFQEILERELADEETIHMSVGKKSTAKKVRELEEEVILAELEKSQQEFREGKGKILKSLADLD